MRSQRRRRLRLKRRHREQIRRTIQRIDAGAMTTAAWYGQYAASDIGHISGLAFYRNT